VQGDVSIPPPAGGFTRQDRAAFMGVGGVSASQSCSIQSDAVAWLCGLTGLILLFQKIFSLWIFHLNQPHFLFSAPSLYLFLSMNCLSYFSKLLEVDQYSRYGVGCGYSSSKCDYRSYIVTISGAERYG
jgi:hypothetical protein